uniref:Uncharacterized protein n=1 Tax=Mola mola TaxID=94237 RepID=A0A3Q3X598_MOLML
ETICNPIGFYLYSIPINTEMSLYCNVIVTSQFFTQPDVIFLTGYMQHVCSNTSLGWKQKYQRSITCNV